LQVYQRLMQKFQGMDPIVELNESNKTH